MLKSITAFTLLLFTSTAAADAWETLFSKAGLSREQIRIDVLNQQNYGASEFQGPMMKSMREEPLRIPFYSRILREDALLAIKEPTKLVTSALNKVGLGIRRSLAGDPLAGLKARSQKPDGLVNALARVHQVAGQPLTSVQAGEIKSRSSAMPKEWAQAVAYLLEAEAWAMEWRKKALNQASAKDLQAVYNAILERPQLGEDDPNGVSLSLRRLVPQVDLLWLMVGGTDLALAVGQSVEELEKLKSDKAFSFEWKSPLGLVYVTTENKANRYGAGQAYLLLIDGAGDDTYETGGGSYSLSQPISILMDLKGNDSYIESSKWQKTKIADSNDRKKTSGRALFGSGIFGYGFLVDFSGKDLYRTTRLSQGFGYFGVGQLWDKSGDDQYDCYVQCQAYGEFGTGLIVDQQGSDRYDIFQRGQGFGGTLGSGYLIDDGKEDDSYAANTTELDFPALVDKNFNTSFAQGAASGIRADITDGHSWAGGFGALIDGGGKNKFTAGFFAQGVAYWHGVGILSTGSGNDNYTAGKYALGAGVHYGVGILDDLGGDDTYKVAQELGIGEGHDFSSGFFFDQAGNDRYEAPDLSLGCASGNGIGIFWDKSGDDTYIAPAQRTLGCTSFRVQAPTFREMSRTIGLFLDSGGSNRFETKLSGPQGASRSGSWRNAGEGTPREQPRMIGVGLVTQAPDTAEPF